MIQGQEVAQNRSSGDDEVGLFDLLIILAKHKKLILTFPLVVALIAAGISFLLPNIYQATTKLLPPQQSQSGAAALLSQFGGMAGMAAGVAGIKNPSDLYIGMLKSRTVADNLIAEFDLKKRYDAETMDATRKELDSKTVITAGKDGLITISVEDEDKSISAKMANAYVAQLMILTKSLALTEAAQRRLFFERQLERSKEKLASAEMQLKGALDSSGVISVDAESRGILETVARLKALASAKEIQLNSMAAFVTTTHPDYRRVQEELASLRGELSNLENGRDVPVDPANRGAGQKNGFQNIKLLRDVKYYQMLYELLAKQYEMARLDEAKDSAIIQVLDPAIAPERKFKPKRSVIILLSALAGLFLAIIAAFVMEAKARALRRPEFVEQWTELATSFKSK